MDLKIKLFLKESMWPCLIIGLTALIYAGSLSHGFVWDDHDYLVYNPSLGSLKGLAGFWTLSDPFSAFPLTVSALWMQHALWGLNPWGYHVVNLTVHILNALLLFGLVRRLAPTLAGVTALLFAIHPIQVETVAWIAEQKNLWCFFFMALAIHSFLDFHEKGKKWDFAKMALFFAAALLSKSIAICFSTIPVLFAWWQRGSVLKRDLLMTGFLLLIGALSVFVPMYNESLGSGSDLSGVFLSEKLILAGKNFFFYIKQIVWPWRFLTLYPKWDVDVLSWGNWVFPSGVLALYFVLYQYRQRLGRGAFALLSFYGISIFPALGFLTVSLFSITYASDHFSYLSVPPVLLLCCGAGRAVFARLPAPSFREWGTLKRSLAVAVVLFLSMVSFRLTLNYKNDVTLFGQLQRECPDSFFANSRFGIVCIDNPDLCSTDKAIKALERAVRIGPDESLTLSKLGAAYELKGLPEQAKEAYLRASIGQDPFSQSHFFREIGRVGVHQRKFSEGIPFLELALSLKSHPDYLIHRQRYTRFQRTSDPSSEKSADYSFLGQAYFLSGDFENALKNFQEAFRLDPQSPSAKKGLEHTRTKLAERDREA
ncbi:MAG: tetratricopeptide repeat protein [Candidatus Omnitrophota bacterium]